MKIRFGTSLAAVILFSLPSISTALNPWPELRVSYYERWIESRSFGLCYHPTPYEPRLTETYSYWNLWHDPWDNGTWETVQGWDDCMPTGFHRNESWSQTSWPCCADRHDPGWKTWWAWSGGDYSEGYYQVAPWLENPPWGKCAYTNINPQSSGNFEWENIYTDRYETRIQLLTGGDAGITNQENIIVLQTGASDANGQPIPISQLTLLGKTPVPDPYNPTNQYVGYVYKKVADHQTLDATVSAPGDCYTYAVFSAVKDRPTLWWNGTNITDTTQVVWVGEKMDMECRFDIGVPTDFFWQVGGGKIKDWIVTGTAANSVKAELVPWGTNAVDRTNAVTKWVWVRDGNNVIICTVAVGGETLTARATFDVRRPDADWRIEAKFGDVVVTNSGQCGAEIWPNYYYLTTGMRCTTNDVAVQFQYSNLDLKGFTGPYEAFPLQVGSFNWKYNMSEPPLWTHPDIKASEVNMTGFDGTYPYAGVRWANTNNGTANDTPKSFPLRDIFAYYWRADSFQTYLMWQPKRMPSIPVPLRVAPWIWSGQAERIDTNSPPTWRLVPPKTIPQSAQGVVISQHPQWTNRIQNITATDTNIYYPTP